MAEPVVEPVKGWTDAGITKIKVPDLRIRSWPIGHGSRTPYVCWNLCEAVCPERNSISHYCSSTSQSLFNLCSLICTNGTPPLHTHTGDEFTQNTATRVPILVYTPCGVLLIEGGFAHRTKLDRDLSLVSSRPLAPFVISLFCFLSAVDMHLLKSHFCFVICWRTRQTAANRLADVDR